MVFFLPFSTDWSLTSALLQHAWIVWATRGLCKDSFTVNEFPNANSTVDSGRRRVFFGTQGSPLRIVFRIENTRLTICSR
jgi:hypothetical protein